MNAAFLEFLAHIDPALYDYIFPRGPISQFVSHRAEQVALNPQPLPPAARAAMFGTHLATQVGRAAVAAQAQKAGGVGMLKQTVDDWCGTRVPFPWPPGWPRPGASDPDPSPWKVDVMFTAATLTFARFAAGLDDGPLREGFRLAAAATAERVGRSSLER